jgi:hypothetical protein
MLKYRSSTRNINFRSMTSVAEIELGTGSCAALSKRPRT